MFENFTAFKNAENGVITDDIGDVRLYNTKVADNLIAGIEFELSNETADGTA